MTAEAALPLVAESARLSSCWSCRQLSPAEPSAGVEAVASLLCLGDLGGLGLGWVGDERVGSIDGLVVVR